MDQINTEYERRRLLDSVKHQSEPGAMRRRLYEIIGDTPTPAYEWMFYAGMGNVDMMPAKEPEVAAVQSLIEEGRLLSTFTESFYGIKTIRLIQHFDDVNFGYKDDDSLVIFRLSSHEGFADEIITPDKRFDAAINALKMRIEYSKTLVDAPITVTDKTGNHNIRPIITNTNFIELRSRQIKLP